MLILSLLRWLYDFSPLLIFSPGSCWIQNFYLYLEIFLEIHPKKWWIFYSESFPKLSGVSIIYLPFLSLSFTLLDPLNAMFFWDALAWWYNLLNLKSIMLALCSNSLGLSASEDPRYISKQKSPGLETKFCGIKRNYYTIL